MSQNKLFQVVNYQTMAQFKSIVTLLLLPINLVWVAIQYYTLGGLKYRKLEKSLTRCLKMTIYRTALSLGPVDAKLVKFFSNDFLINKLLPIFYGTITSKLPGFGERYDENSIWLVKQPNHQPNDPIIFYLHGGGFFIEAQREQFESVLSIYALLDPKLQKRTSILFLDYKLASDGYKFPTQINQLNDSYHRLLKDGYENITLLGDSAGGNLVICILDVLKSQQKNQSNETIIFPKNIVLVSPWVRLNPQKISIVPGNSYYDNINYDMITYKTFEDYSHLYPIVGELDINDIQVSPISKSPIVKEDWQGIPTYEDPKSSVLVIVGEDESFRDDVLEWSKFALDVPFFDRVKYGNSHKFFQSQDYEYQSDSKNDSADVRLYVEPWGVHDSTFFFENNLLRQIKNNPSISLESLDKVEFFGIYKITKYLNEKL